MWGEPTIINLNCGFDPGSEWKGRNPGRRTGLLTAELHVCHVLAHPSCPLMNKRTPLTIINLTQLMLASATALQKPPNPLKFLYFLTELFTAIKDSSQSASLFCHFISSWTFYINPTFLDWTFYSNQRYIWALYFCNCIYSEQSTL